MLLHLPRACFRMTTKLDVPDQDPHGDALKTEIIELATLKHRHQALSRDTTRRPLSETVDAIMVRDLAFMLDRWKSNLAHLETLPVVQCQRSRLQHRKRSE
jgi:hypothetical protein